MNISNLYIPIELIQYIFDFLEFKNQISFKLTCKDYNQFKIYDLYNISLKYRIKLDDDILKNYPFLKYLDASNNKKITNVSHMTNLQILNASGSYCEINNQGIENLNLIELNAYNNYKIINVSFMTNLKILNVSGWCGIDDNDIKNLNLIELNAHNNNKITNVSFMTNLQVLNASGLCGIDDKNIRNLNLIKLISIGNYKITIKI